MTPHPSSSPQLLSAVGTGYQPTEGHAVCRSTRPGQKGGPSAPLPSPTPPQQSGPLGLYQKSQCLTENMGPPSEPRHLSSVAESFLQAQPLAWLPRAVLATPLNPLWSSSLFSADQTLCCPLRKCTAVDSMDSQSAKREGSGFSRKSLSSAQGSPGAAPRPPSGQPFTADLTGPSWGARRAQVHPPLHLLPQ